MRVISGLMKAIDREAYRSLWISMMALFTALSFPQIGRADNLPVVHVGVLAVRGLEAAERSWAATFSELNHALPDYRFEMVPGTANYLTAAVAAGRLDFLITNPGHYLELKIDYSATALATEQKMDGATASESVAATIIAPTNSRNLQQIGNLKGARIATVAPDTFGFRAVQRELLDREIRLREDTDVLFVGYPVDGVIAQLRLGHADAGIIRACLLESLIADGSVARDEFKVIGRRPSGSLPCLVSTRQYPGWPFVRVGQTSSRLAAEVQRVLLGMQPGGGDVVWTEAEDYQSVQDLYRTLKVGPYAPFSRLGIIDLIDQYRYWLMIIAMAGAWWIIHTTRVAHLLRRRTEELKLAHEQARLKNEQMEHAVRLSLLGEMASSLAHEINQPLAAILSYARGCERRLQSGTDLDGVLSGVERIAVQAERAGAIVRRMREFVRKNPSRQVAVDPGPVLSDAIGLFEPMTGGRSVMVEADIPLALGQIRADQIQIEQVVINLLQNALEAIADRPDGLIRLKAEALDHVLKVTVTDNGPGVAPGSVDLLFDPFFTTKTKGLGLGLSLSRTIIEAHGGHLGIESTLPGEMTFAFELPLIEDQGGD